MLVCETQVQALSLHAGFFRWHQILSSALETMLYAIRLSMTQDQSK